MKSCGHNFQVASSCRLIGLDTISVGHDVYFAPNVVLNGGGRITVEDSAMIGIGSVVVSGNHTMQNGSFRFGKRDERPIKICHGSWVGANCVVLAGAVLPMGSILGAGSVLAAEFALSGLYAGSPAKLCRKFLN